MSCQEQTHQENCLPPRKLHAPFPSSLISFWQADELDNVVLFFASHTLALPKAHTQDSPVSMLLAMEVSVCLSINSLSSLSSPSHLSLLSFCSTKRHLSLSSNNSLEKWSSVLSKQSHVTRSLTSVLRDFVVTGGVFYFWMTTGEQFVTLVFCQIFHFSASMSTSLSKLTLSASASAEHQLSAPCIVAYRGWEVTLGTVEITGKYIFF